MNKSRLLTLAAASVALAPSLAMAHPGHDTTSSFVSGLAHPLSGLDHVLMIVATGMWSAALRPAGRILVAICLALSVSLGALLPIAPLSGTALETAIALTVVGAGLLLAMAGRWPTWAMAAVAALFALIHGLAHGTEGPAGTLGYVPGLAVASASLATGAAWLAARLGADQPWLRLTGAASATLGAVALLSS